MFEAVKKYHKKLSLKFFLTSKAFTSNRKLHFFIDKYGFKEVPRKNWLLIHGLPESKNENTDELVIVTIKEKMWKEIEKDEIDRSHRLGAPKNNGKSRPIIKKFVRYNTRCRIFKNKKKWRGKA